MNRRFKPMGMSELALMLAQMIEFTPEAKEDIKEIRREIARRKLNLNNNEG